MTLIEFAKTINKRYYVAEARECKSDKLIITFTAGRDYLLYKKDYGVNMLFITNTKQTSYYLMNPGFIVNKLREVIVEGGIKNVIFVGHSKGGFGALLWGGLLDKIKKNDFKVFTLAFSPQTLLYPYNQNIIGTPSYTGRLLKNIEIDKNLAICAQRYGNLVDVFSNFRPNAIIFYSCNPMDCKEAERVKYLFTTINKTFPITPTIQNM